MVVAATKRSPPSPLIALRNDRLFAEEEKKPPQNSLRHTSKDLDEKLKNKI